jgi:hypothetical protein
MRGQLLGISAQLHEHAIEGQSGRGLAHVAAVEPANQGCHVDERFACSLQLADRRLISVLLAAELLRRLPSPAGSVRVDELWDLTASPVGRKSERIDSQFLLCDFCSDRLGFAQGFALPLDERLAKTFSVTALGWGKLAAQRFAASGRLTAASSTVSGVRNRRRSTGMSPDG